MLDSLHIQNYRLFKDLKIEKLGQVNLISGKNNCGKTALLEALRILGSDANNLVINDIVAKRGDFQLGIDSCLSSLVGNSTTVNIVDHIKINGISIDALFGYMVTFEEFYPNKFKKFKSFNLEAKTLVNNPIIGDVIYLPLVFENENDAKFWDKISLTPKEEDVIKILKIVDNRIKIVRYDSGNIKVLLEGEDKPRLMKNLGEGVNRLFSIALALVNAQNKMLLIDEFEVGLHHSVQTQLWEIIFKYAKEWNIQVFVTTHSLDTVRAFAEVSDKFEGMGEYMRLQKSRTTDDIEAVVYSKKSLEYAIDDSLEMR
jgi:AAA15 family ATPase/GTPase